MVTTSAGTKSKIRPIPEGDASSFIIHDNSSEIVKLIPEKYVEPLIIIARIKGFDGVDDYVIHLIKDKLEIFADTSHRDDDIDDSFQQYMHDMIIGKKDIPNTWARNSTTKATTVNEDTKKPEEEQDLK